MIPFIYKSACKDYNVFFKHHFYTIIMNNVDMNFTKSDGKLSLEKFIFV